MEELVSLPQREMPSEICIHTHRLDAFLFQDNCGSHRICSMLLNASLLDFKRWMTSTRHHPIYLISPRRNLSFVVGCRLFFMMCSFVE